MPRFRRATTSPSGPEQPVCEKKKKQTEKCREQVQKIEIADREVDADGAPESGDPHHRNNLNKASRERCAAGHKKQRAAYRAQAAAKACAIVRDDRDQRVGYMAQGTNVKPNKSQIGRNKNRGHAKDRDCASGQDQARCTSD
jgi:hypothetical protein